MTDEWYIIAFHEKGNYWGEMFNRDTLFVHKDDFDVVARACRHTHKRMYYLRISDHNCHSFPEYLQRAYNNREQYGQTPE